MSRRLENAPLVEVIAEVHWHLDTSPTGEPLDLHWFDLAHQAKGTLSAPYPVVEVLQPVGLSVPLDMLGRVPLLRFRPAPAAWPVVQLGQGLFTFNVVPPYDGWDTNVRDGLAQALKLVLDGVSVLGARRLQAVRLHYRDAFTASHGVNDPDDFLRQILGLPVANRVAAALGATKAQLQGQMAFAQGGEAAGSVLLRYGTGQKTAKVGDSPQQAAVMDFIITVPGSGPMLVAALMDKFEKAHSLAEAAFHAVVPPDVMAILQRRSLEG